MSPTSDGATATDRRSELYDAMAHPHRRWVVDALETCDSLDLRALATHVLRREGDGEGPSRREVSIGLYHVHLPKLDDVGVVEFDPEERTATLRGRDGPSDVRLDSGYVAVSD